MKNIKRYQSLGITSQEEAFDYLLSNMKDTIRSYDYFVAWDKVLGNVLEVEVALNILNSLIGKQDIENSFKEIIKKYPEVVPVIPLLIAVRDSEIKIAEVNRDITYSFQRKSSYSEGEIEAIVFFAKKSGLLKVLREENIKNLVDYSIGVEVGLDTNARKNRSGSSMESLAEVYLNAICEKHGFQYISQATAAKIFDNFGKKISVDKADRHFDFAVNANDKLYLIEVNYYSGGGSKLKSVAGEFSTLFNLVSNEETGFIWITDGVGWSTAKRPLSEAYNTIDFVLNLNMVENGFLEEILTKGL